MARMPWWAWVLLGIVAAVAAGVLLRPEAAGVGIIPAELARRALVRASVLRAEASALRVEADAVQARSTWADDAAATQRDEMRARFRDGR